MSCRLPTSVTPTNYSLTFTPDFKTHTFKGQAVIDVLVNTETSRVSLNAKDFNVVNVQYEGKSAQKFELNNEQEILQVDFSSPLSPGKGKLSVEYNGVVNDTLKGFFRSKYQTPEGQEKFIYVTKFEPAFARFAFPCWDEPAIKATFDITLIVPKDLVAVSNMPIKEETVDPKDSSRKIVSFQQSVKMSTYLAAWAIGEFDYIEGTSEDGVLCRVYTPVGNGERGRFALDLVTKAIPFYSNYFGVPYPLPKMDFLAVKEYPCGAMENWGLVTFKEIALLVDPKVSSTMNKQRVALTCTHETAHMWFGNYVTMEWWSDLWLNEGYATFMEHVCTEAILPEYKVWETFVSDYTCHALELDALASSHPIQVEVDHPSSVGEIFDAISYYKGASVIRMLCNYIGEETFKQGMKLYLTKHAFGNAETEDLWAALTQVSGKPVDLVMPTWTKQMGYPILNVKEVTQSQNEKVIVFSYEKFWADPKQKEKTSPKWIIPVTIRKQSQPGAICVESLIDRNPGMDIEIRVKAEPKEWVKVNADFVGYYRVCYSTKLLQQFLPSIKDKSMGTIDRLGIVDDLFATVVGGMSPSTDILTTLKAYAEEDNYPVLNVINSIISSFNVILAGTNVHEKFVNYAQSLFESNYKRLGWDPIAGESSHDANLRTILITRLVGLGHKDALQEGERRFEKHIKKEATLHPDVIPAAFRAALLGKNCHSGFDSLVKLYKESSLQEEQYRILRALGSARDASLIQKVLEFGMSENVNKQDIAVLMINFSSKEGREIAWEFFKKNVKHFQQVYPSGGWYLRALVKLPASFTTNERAQEVETFFKQNKFSGVDRSVGQALESIRINEAWIQRDFVKIAQFFSD